MIKELRAFRRIISDSRKRADAGIFARDVITGSGLAGHSTESEDKQRKKKEKKYDDNDKRRKIELKTRKREEKV